MKLGMLRKFRHFAHIIFGLYYRIKCIIYYLFYGGVGISHVVQKMPNTLIIPLLNFLGADICEDSDIDSGLILHRIRLIKDLKKLKIGKRVHIGHNVLLDLSANIEIGSYSAFGAGCQIWTHTGNWTKNRNDEFDKKNPVIIGEAVICYSNVIISQGVKINDFSRVGASSVVIRDIPKKMFYAGVPAKFIKNIEIE